MDRDRVGPPVDGELRRMLLSPGQLEDDVRQELRFHVEGRVAELVARGWPEADARAHVLASFGDLERIVRECTEIGMERLQRERRTQKIADAVTDVRYALRTFRRSPVFTGVVLLTLALGIGATTAVFTVVDRVAIRQLPFHEPERLVSVWEQNLAQGITADNPSGSNLHDWRERNRTFEGLAGWVDRSLTLTGLEQPEALSAVAVTGDFFSVLGIAPRIGRGFTGDDEPPDGAATVILSHGAWERLFGGESMVGRSILLNGSPYEVIGIMPEGLAAPHAQIDVWVAGRLANPDWHRQTRSLGVIGRLAGGVSIEQAQADMDRVAAQLAAEYPESNRGWGVSLVPARDQVVGDAARVLYVLLAAVIAVLLIACANVANLLLGRAATRVREFGVRAAIGASVARLRRQLLTESLALGLIGGLGGMGLAYLGVRLFLRLEPRIPRVEEVGIDLRILGVAFAVSIGTALLFGLIPALRAGRADVSAALKASEGWRSRGADRRGRARPMLVVSEIALSLILLVGAGLFLRSFLALRAVDPGFEREGVYAAKVSLDLDAYSDNESRARYFDELRRGLLNVPGVSSAGVTSALPMDPTGTDFDLPRHAQDHPRVPEPEAPQTDYRIVSPGYFETLGIELLSGRTFDDFDRAETPPVLVVTESLATTLWPGDNPLGKTITIYYVRDTEWEVVGVVRDTHHQGLAVPPSHQMFVPLSQAELLFGYMTVVVKAAAGVPLPYAQIREVAASIDANEPLFELQSMEDLVGQSIARDSLATASLAVFAVLALVLALAGIYGVTSYQVASRRHEIGVRMALGARRGVVVRQVLTDALTLALAGVAIGLLGAGLLTRIARSLLFGVGPLDPPVFVAVPALLLTAAVLAALPSARRAASIDPVRAMRAE